MAKQVVGERDVQSGGQKRKERPGQLPPVYDREKSRSRQAGSGGPSTAGDAWRERTEAQAAAWAEKRPFHVGRYTASFPQLVQYQQEEQAAQLRCILDRCQAALERHSCCQQGPGSTACLQPGATRTVTYQGIAFSAPLEVPTSTCVACGDNVTVHAYDVGCAPSAPTAPNYWIDMKALELFRALQTAGTSVESALLASFGQRRLRKVLTSAAGQPLTNRHACLLVAIAPFSQVLQLRSTIPSGCTTPTLRWFPVRTG